MKFTTILKAVPFLLMTSFLSCKEEEVIKNCTDKYLEQVEMVKYSGEEIGCKTFLKLYEYESKQYYIMDSYCADMISYPKDCEGKSLCDQQLQHHCDAFFEKAVFVGIVGIKQ